MTGPGWRVSHREGTMNPATEPREIELEGPTAPLRIVWEDGHVSVYDLEFLRRICPCADCNPYDGPSEVRDDPKPLPPGAAEIKAIRETGHYALHITWRDGHDTGYYSFEHLRRHCPCSICRPSMEI